MISPAESLFPSRRGEPGAKPKRKGGKSFKVNYFWKLSSVGRRKKERNSTTLKSFSEYFNPKEEKMKG